MEKFSKYVGLDVHKLRQWATAWWPEGNII